MSRRAENRQIVAELGRLAELGVLTPEQEREIAERYPVGRWNVISLIRWFSILGVVSAGVGLLVLARHLGDLQTLLEVGLGLAAVGLLTGGWWLLRADRLPRVGASLQLLGAFAIQGLTFALGVHYSTGSGNWPALVGIDTALFVGLAYALRNRLILIYACVNFFVWFGGQTGYMSGWGVYWLKMSYPVRFLAAGVFVLLIARLHAGLTGPFQAFSRVYAHYGLLVIHLALWFLALFGYFEEHVRWADTGGERLLFSALWAVASVGCIVGGARIGLRLMRGYGYTFLVINAYTFYGQFVIRHSADAWFVHLLLVGGSLVGLGAYLERQLRPAAASLARE